MARARSDLLRPWTVEEFLEWERTQEERYEYVDGIIRMMVGGTLDHNTIALNIAARLHERLRGGPCRAFVEGVKVASGTATMYPDVVVSCAPVAGTDDVVREPVVVFEVLSRSTQGFDRGAKWDQYRTLDSLHQYVLVAQNELKVDVFTRRGQIWELAVMQDPAGVLRVERPGVELTLAEIYEGSSLDQARPEPG